MEYPGRCVYMESGVAKSFVDENKRMGYIDELNRDLHNRSEEETKKNCNDC